MRPAAARRFWVLTHRYVGLLLAGFLILEGLTGSVLAYKVAIGEWLAPQTFAPPHPGMTPMGLGALAAHLEAIEPKARVGFFSIDGRQAGFSMLPRTDPATGKPYALDFDHIVLDPWTGRELARHRFGDLSQGALNIVPFIYNLHQNLAVGPWGMILLGVVAVLWTIDCFVAAHLTLPASWRDFLSRWRVAWLIKQPTSPFRLNFDLHRAGGLWLWPALFVFAWSSVMFTLPDQVYGPVTKALFDYRSDADVFAMMNRRPPRSTPKLDWVHAQAEGERLMSKAAARYRFHIIRPYGMAYIPGWNVYTYAVDSGGNLQAHAWGTSLWLDGDTGALVDLDIAATRRAGNTVDGWMRALHFGDLRDNGPFRAFVCLMGLAVTLLSGTGIYIWVRKRRGEVVRRRRRALAARTQT
jgi:uncharacterized iron-regulated membrane protein